MNESNINSQRCASPTDSLYFDSCLIFSPGLLHGRVQREEINDCFLGRIIVFLRYSTVVIVTESCEDRGNITS
jgi:hypothetical protein